MGKRLLAEGFGQGFEYLFPLAGVLDVFFQVAVGGLDFSARFLNLSFQLQVVVADEVAGNFLDFAFSFFETTLGLILVHGELLITR